MRILILTFGTRGDVQPYVALGKQLIQSGHQVSICASREFESFITKHGLSYASMNNDILDFMRTDEGKTVMENAGNMVKMIITAVRILPKMKDLLNRQVRDTWNSVQQADPELILFHPKAIGAKDFAERLGIPIALTFYLPMYVPTGERPVFAFPRLPLGKWYNRLTYKVIQWATWRAQRTYISKWRKENGLPASRRGYLEKADGEMMPALFGLSPQVYPPPADWPNQAVITGYWFLDDTTNWQPSPELTQFLEQGPPPVYLGFGSIFGRDPKRTGDILLEAIRLAQVRAILGIGWGGIQVDQSALPDSVIAVESVPHEWLFPQVSAVVHHGGCGTTAAGLRAGRPTIICPFFGDQPFWGQTVHELGVGTKPIPQRRLSAKKLAQALVEVTTNKTMQENAQQLGKKIQAETGTQNAVEFIHQMFGPT